MPDIHSSGLADMLDDLQAMVAWWRERQEALQDTGENRQTQRITYHVETRWVDAVKRQADLEGVSITQMVNQAFRAYFTQK